MRSGERHKQRREPRYGVADLGGHAIGDRLIVGIAGTHGKSHDPDRGFSHCGLRVRREGARHIGQRDAFPGLDLHPFNQPGDMLALFAQPVLEILRAGNVQPFEQFARIGKGGAPRIGDIAAQFAHIDMKSAKVEPNACRIGDQ